MLCGNIALLDSGAASRHGLEAWYGAMASSRATALNRSFGSVHLIRSFLNFFFGVNCYNIRSR